MKVISRNIARQNGLKFYFTGKPCQHGHISLKKVSNYTCLECEKVHRSTWRRGNQKHISQHQTYRYNTDESFREKMLQNHKNWRDANPDKSRAASMKHYLKDPSRQHARTAKRRALMIQAIPSWADMRTINNIYREAHQLSTSTTKYQVDHIVPLQGRDVCGLHCEANLQILSEKENKSKGNKF